MSQYDKLKGLALAATPGSWSVDPLYGFIMDAIAEPIEICNPDGASSNAAYIAEANPAAILELIAQRDELLAALRTSREVILMFLSERRDLSDSTNRAVTYAIDISDRAIAKAVQP
jgi:hypothetical protein